MRKNIVSMLVGFAAGMIISLVNVVDHKECMEVATEYINELESELNNVDDSYVDDVMSETDAYQNWYELQSWR